jgi:hypothetical protein
MSAEAEQDQLIKQTRLYLAPPHVVYEELKQQAERTRAEWFAYDDKKIEPMLVERNEPLINVGLAAFGANRDVYSALYKHSHLQIRLGLCSKRWCQGQRPSTTAMMLRSPFLRWSPSHNGRRSFSGR